MAILGIDEVGRGPLAGPLVVGAVILPNEEPKWIEELKDSKKLTKKKREELNAIILERALATGLGWVSAAELDEIGISAGLRLATKKAVKSIQKSHVPFSQIIIDGKVNFLTDTALGRYVSVLPKADDLISEVSAASIIAKVARDHYMIEVAKRFPEYGFERHVGYGTAKHLAAIREFGIVLEHRKSFEPIRSMVGFSGQKKDHKNTTKIGRRGEAVVAEFLIKEGHRIVARNFKTKLVEIDIVSIKDDQIYFTEVKYRKNSVYGDGIEAITKEKQAKMRFAVENFLEIKRQFKKLSPLLAVADVSGDDFRLNNWFPLT